MSRVVVVVVLAAGGILAISAVPPALGGKVVRTHLDQEGWSEGPTRQGFTRLSVFEQIHSTKQACKQRRQAKLYFKRRGKEPRLADSDRSSRHGAIALTGRARFRPHKLIVKVFRKRITRRNPFTCSGAREVIRTRHF